MDYLAELGRKRTILISISILLITIHTIYYSNSLQLEIKTTRIIGQAVRFFLTAGLLIMIYKGKSWAKIVGLVLFSLGAIGALFGLIMIEGSFLNKTPLLVMFFIYSVAIFHFNFSVSFKAFYNYQNSLNE
ncbi:hypothetical protein [Tenacibaculum amylolyticum]|uniref:hypothetical protein n=1 Tax=Tenacibaculum amylolyticum TaxID=104269 RepID=UPI0038950B95